LTNQARKLNLLTKLKTNTGLETQGKKTFTNQIQTKIDKTNFKQTLTKPSSNKTLTKPSSNKTLTKPSLNKN
jgi:hypothetical protein